MVSVETIKPKSCKLLNAAVPAKKSFSLKFENSSELLPIDSFPYANNKSTKFTKNNDEHLFDGNSKKSRFSSDFIFLDETLHTADTKTKLKWTKQLILKLNLIHSTGFKKDKIIDLDCLKINSEQNLVIDLINSKKQSSFNEFYYNSPNYYFNSRLSFEERDIWSTGICIYYINTSNFPWKKASVSDRDFRVWIKDGQFKDAISGSLQSLLTDMLNVNQSIPIKLIVNKLFEIKANQKIMS